MKKRLMICAMAASAALFAGEDVTSGNVYGIMRVSDTATNTVIGVPWVKVGEGEVLPATVASLVNAASLSNGDVLYVYDDSRTSVWRAYIVENGTWGFSTTVSSSGVDSSAPSEKAVAQGSGMILQRSDTTKPIYLCGRLPLSGVSSAINAGTSDAPVRTLFANAGTVDMELNASNVEGVVGDRIIVPLDGGASRQYEYKDGNWGTYTQQTVTRTTGKRTITATQDVWTPGCTIPAGKGAWYLSVGGTPTINWQ